MEISELRALDTSGDDVDSLSHPIPTGGAKITLTYPDDGGIGGTIALEHNSDGYGYTLTIYRHSPFDINVRRVDYF